MKQAKLPYPFIGGKQVAHILLHSNAVYMLPTCNKISEHHSSKILLYKLRRLVMWRMRYKAVIIIYPWKIVHPPTSHTYNWQDSYYSVTLHVSID